MADANVQRIDALEAFAESLQKREETLRYVLEEINIELQRLQQQIQDLAPDYWKREFRIAERRTVEARDALSRCEAVIDARDEKPCSSERKRFHVCKERLDYCARKLREIKSCQNHWEQLHAKIQVQRSEIEELVEVSFPISRQRLHSIIEPLKAYAKLNRD